MSATNYGNATKVGKADGRAPAGPVYVPRSFFSEALRDGTANRKMRRAAKKLGITPAPAVQS